MAPRVVLPSDVGLRDLPASADRGLWRRAIALAGAALVHAAVLAALIRSEPHVLSSPGEPIRVSLVPAPGADQSQALAPPPAEVPPPAIMSAPPRTTEARPEPRTPAPSRAETAPPEAATPAPALEPLAVSPAPAVPPAPGIAMTAPQTTEIVPPSPYLPLNDAQRESLQKQLHTGEHDNAGAPLRETEVNVAAAHSKRAPPLTVAEREKLQKQLHTGEHDNAGAPAREKEVNIAAARSKHAAPLTAEEWKTLDKMYLVGSTHRGTDEAAKAIQVGALSLTVALADQQKELEAMYSVGRLSRSNVGPVQGGRTEARLVAQVTPDLPNEFADRAFAFAVVARLTVGSDGSVAEVVLAEPTSEPDLNQALVVALQKWRFYPAVDSGKPVASTVEIRFTISAPGVAIDKKGRVSPSRGTPA